MMNNNSKRSKLARLGAVWETKNSTPENPKYCVKLGQDKQRDPKYNRTVELIVRDGEGNVVSQHTDPFLTLLDPRKSPLLNEEQVARIPGNLQFEVFIGDAT